MCHDKFAIAPCTQAGFLTLLPACLTQSTGIIEGGGGHPVAPASAAAQTVVMPTTADDGEADQVAPVTLTLPEDFETTLDHALGLMAKEVRTRVR